MGLIRLMEIRVEVVGLTQPLPNECVFVVMKLLNSSLMSVIYYVLPYYMSTINSNVTLPLYVC